jgi:hypothetical protein
MRLDADAVRLVLKETAGLADQPFERIKLCSSH